MEATRPSNWAKAMKMAMRASRPSRGGKDGDKGLVVGLRGGDDGASWC